MLTVYVYKLGDSALFDDKRFLEYPQLSLISTHHQLLLSNPPVCYTNHTLPVYSKQSLACTWQLCCSTVAWCMANASAIYYMYVSYSIRTKPTRYTGINRLYCTTCTQLYFLRWHSSMTHDMYMYIVYSIHMVLCMHVHITCWTWRSCILVHVTL